MEAVQTESTGAMPLLAYLADTNAVSDYHRGLEGVQNWFAAHRGQVGISTLTLAELRRGIELKPSGKVRSRLESFWRFIVEDYRERIFVFDEAAALEWGRMMAGLKNQLPPYDDALIAAIALSCKLTVVTSNSKHFPGCKTVNPRSQHASVQ